MCQPQAEVNNEVGYEGKVAELGLSDHLPIKLIIDS